MWVKVDFYNELIRARSALPCDTTDLKIREQEAGVAAELRGKRMDAQHKVRGADGMHREGQAVRTR